MSCKHILGCAVLSCLLASSVIGCDASKPAGKTATAASTEDVAAAFVQRYKMGAGLEALVNGVARTTATYGLLVQKHGARQADALIAREVTALLPGYQPRWDRNLATIYARHFSSEELQSLRNLGPASPHAAKVNAVEADVAQEMKTLSSPLLEQFVAEALRRAAAQP